MLHVVYINYKGFICTLHKVTNRYTTTQDIEVADFYDRLEDAQSTADFFNGVVLSFKDGEKKK